MSLEQQLDRLANALEANTKALLGGATAATSATPGKLAADKLGKTSKAAKAAVVEEEAELEEGLGNDELGLDNEDEPTAEDARTKLMEVKAKKGRDAAKEVMKACGIESANAIPDAKVAKLIAKCLAKLDE